MLNSLGLSAGQMIARKKQQDKDWVASHRALVNERARKRAKLWRINNPELYKERRKREYARNKERVIERVLAWQKANPERFKQYQLKSWVKQKAKKHFYKTAKRCSECEVILRTNTMMCDWCMMSIKRNYVNH